MPRTAITLVVCVTVGLSILSSSARVSVGAEEGEMVTIRFDNEMAAMLNARRWDETKQQWLGDSDEMFFDGVHRFALLRFPGCAQAIHEKLAEGYRVESAKLLLHWQKQEFLRVDGYMWRGRLLTDKQEPTWHARACLLRRPWTDDAEIGPTWNAYVNGAGYWRNGGARCAHYDRFPQPLGDARLGKAQPEGAIDVTASLTSEEFGSSVEARLRTLEDCGFLVDKVDPDRMYRNTAIARVWVERPELVVTFRRAEGPVALGQLPPPVDVHKLAEALKAQGGDGVPTSSVPDNLDELARPFRVKPDNMPDWMWKRVQEVGAFRSPSYTWLNDVYDGLESGDREQFLAALDLLLNVPPGFDVGHFDMDMLLPLVQYGPLLPEVVRHHIRGILRLTGLPPMTGLSGRTGSGGGARWER